MNLDTHPLCEDCEYFDYCWQSDVDYQHDPDLKQCELVRAVAEDMLED